MKPRFRMLVSVAMLAMVTAACTGGHDAAHRNPAVPDHQATADHESDDTLTVFTNRQIDEPLFEQFEQQTGIKVRARWGDPIDLAGQIIADGANSPADVFYAPLSDALGALSATGRLATLTHEQLDQVAETHRSPDGTWVGTSGRAHAVFYNTDQLTDDDLPDSILGFTDPAWRGRIGWDPTSRSLQDVITELRQLQGEDTARGWLEGIQANAPATFQGTNPIVNAVAAGEIINVGFGSHTYLNDLQADGDAKNIAAKFYPGKPGGLLNVAGVGIINGTDNQPAATTFVNFLLSQPAQQHLAETAFEIPLVGDIGPPEGIPTVDELTVPELDMRQFEQLQDARRLLTEVGIIS